MPAFILVGEVIDQAQFIDQAIKRIEHTIMLNNQLLDLTRTTLQKVIQFMADASTTLEQALMAQNLTLTDLLADVRALISMTPPNNTAAIAAIDAATASMAAVDLEVEAALNPPPPPSPPGA